MIRHDTIKILGNDATPGLLKAVAAGHTQLPEFQRSYLWNKSPDRVTTLLSSIAQGWPAGSLLLMEGSRGFQTRYIDGWHPSSLDGEAPEPARLLLDGQQRITGLFQAYFDTAPDHVFFIDIKTLLKNEVVDVEADGTFRWMRRTTWKKQYATIEDQRKAGFVTVSNLMNETAWEHWKDGLNNESKAAYQRLKTEGALAGLSDYEFPSTHILKDAPDEALASIFVTINQQGIKLTTFDLAVARTIRRKTPSDPGFNLRESWNRCIGVANDDEEPPQPLYPRFRSYSIPPEAVLRLILMMTEPGTKVSDGKILGMNPDTVREHFAKAAKLLDEAMAFLANNAGLVPQSLADSNYLLPIALAAHHDKSAFKSDALNPRLLEWYWAAMFSARFGRGRTGDVVPHEARDLLHWLAAESKVPAIVRNFWKTWDQDVIFRLVGPMSTNKHLLAALLSLEVASGATDWRGIKQGDNAVVEFKIQEADGRADVALDVHHMFPRATKVTRQKRVSKYRGVEIPGEKDAYETVINRCLLLKSTNTSIGATPFGSVTKHKGVEPDWVATYLVDPSAAAWSTFVTKRLGAIELELRKRVPKRSR